MNHREQLGFASKQIEAFKGEVRSYIDSRPYSLVTERDPQVSNTREIGLVSRAFVAKSPPPEWKHQLRNYVNDMRVALDYLAYSLASKGAGGTPRKEGKVEFPIFLNDTDYKRDAKRKIAEWPAGAQTVVETLQPYHRRNDPDLHPLWLLHSLDNPSKHREPLAAGAVIGDASLSFGNVDGIEMDFNTRPETIYGAFDSGAVVARLRVRPTKPDAKMQMEVEVPFGVAFSKTGPARGAPAVQTLEEIRDHVRDKVFPALEPYL